MKCAMVLLWSCTSLVPRRHDNRYGQCPAVNFYQRPVLESVLAFYCISVNTDIDAAMKASQLVRRKCTMEVDVTALQKIGNSTRVFISECMYASSRFQACVLKCVQYTRCSENILVYYVLRMCCIINAVATIILTKHLSQSV